MNKFSELEASRTIPFTHGWLHIISCSGHNNKLRVMFARVIYCLLAANSRKLLMNAFWNISESKHHFKLSFLTDATLIFHKCGIIWKKIKSAFQWCPSMSKILRIHSSMKVWISNLLVQMILYLCPFLLSLLSHAWMGISVTSIKWKRRKYAFQPCTTYFSYLFLRYWNIFINLGFLFSGTHCMFWQIHSM